MKLDIGYFCTNAKGSNLLELANQTKSLMKIVLLGYGKMGQMIEQQAIARGHTITCKINRKNFGHISPNQLVNSEVAIDFSSPDSAVQMIKFALEQKLPVVSGTTGWLDDMDHITAYVEKLNGSFLYASNFSIGVNIFFKLNKLLGEIMAGHPQYDVSIEEIHHIHKVDSPSGTAISLAEDILECLPPKERWINAKSKDPGELSILSKRLKETPGTHTVTYSGQVDQIQIAHRADSREGFASGAILAAEWILDKKGIFTMDDVLKL